MQVKVLQIGNSAGVVIPKEIRREMGLRIGENISLNKKGDKIVIDNPKKKATSRVDIRFAKIVDEFMDEHKDVLAELSKR